MTEGSDSRGALNAKTPDLASDLIEAVVRRDRVVVVLALILISLMAWGYLLSGAGMDMSMSMPMEWTFGYALMMFLMWWIMMVAMMLPSAAPMILLFALVNRRSRERGAPYVPTTFFAAGYLIAWGAFSLAATLLQWSLDQAGWLTMEMASAGKWLGGSLLLLAGVYQLTPLKHACLRHCRGPIDFITRHWRPGNNGALRMGLVHGAFCVGCCWMLMGLLFYGGVMSLYWIAGLAALVMLEKILPAGHRFGYLVGAAFFVWGSVLLTG